jgi:ATP-dependent Clp protease adaptor protein ClpS
MKTLSQTSPEGYVDVQELIETERKLIVHNDEVNTFDWVIETLIKICRHTQAQAEQCAMIIHTKGKYAVKHGDYKKLSPMKEAIAERGIVVTIE